MAKDLWPAVLLVLHQPRVAVEWPGKKQLIKADAGVL